MPNDTRKCVQLRHAIAVAAEAVPGYDFARWIGILAPAFTPAAPVNTLIGIVVKAARVPDLVNRFTKDATDVVANSRAEFRTVIQSEAKCRAQVVKDGGMRADQSDNILKYMFLLII